MSGQSASSVRLCLLGPLELNIDGVDVRVGRAQVRRLLALLGLRVGENTPAEMMVEYLWPDTPPADPRAALRVVLSRLRSAIAPYEELLEPTSTGQRLRIQTDIAEFDRLVTLARAPGAAESSITSLRSALDLWRGEPFADIEESTFLTPVSARLTEQRWQSVSELAQTLLQVRDYQQLIELVQPWVREQPHREELATALAIGLAMSGRKTEGLDVLERTRVDLRDNFGLEPSAHLQSVETDIVSGSTDLAPTRETARAGTTRRFVGRHNELQKLIDAPGPVLLVADGGSGKSALLAQAAHAMRQEGIDVVMATAKAKPDRPMQVAADLLEQVVPLGGTSQLSPAAQSAASRLLPHLFPANASAVPLTREALFEAVVEILDASPNDRQRVFVVDDYQWADRSSAEIIGSLVASNAKVVVGTRPSVPERLVLDDDNFTELGLPPLSRADVTELATQVAPRLGHDDAIDLIYQQSDGNPLFVGLLLDLMAEGAFQPDRLPTSILVAVQQRLDALSVRSRDTLGVASVFGVEFPVGLLRLLIPTCDVDLTEAVEANIVELSNDEALGRFTHHLVSNGAYQLLSDGQRVVLHDEIGRLLEQEEASASEYAPHAVAAAEFDPVRAMRASLHAASDLKNVLAWGDVLHHVDNALHLADQARDPLLESRLHVLRGATLRATGASGSDEALYKGASLAREVGDDHTFVEAVTELCTFGRASEYGAAQEHLAELLEAALDLELEAEQRACLCAAGTVFYSLSDQQARGRELFSEGFEIATTIGNPEVEGFVLMHAHIGLDHPNDLDKLRQASVRLREISEDDADFLWESAFLQFGLHATNANREGAEESIETMRRLTPLVKRRNRDFGMAFTEVAFATLTGDLDDAELHVGTTLEVGLSLYGDSWASNLCALLLVAVRQAQGRLDEVLEIAKGVLESRPDFVTSRAVIAAAAAAADKRSVCKEYFVPLAATGFESLLPDFTWRGIAVLMVEPAEYLADADAARHLYSMLKPFEGHMAWSGVVTFGSIDGALARLAQVFGDHEAADIHRQVDADLLARLR